MSPNTSARAIASLLRSLAIGLALVSLTFSIACDDEDDSGPVVVRKAKKDTAKADKAAASAGLTAEEIAYTYDPVNRRDPFKTYFDELVLVAEDAQNLTELQRINLDSLNLVGVVTGTATPMAMIQDGSGKGYTIKIGTLIGKRFGQVKQIRRNEIVVQEEFRDFTGKRIPVFKSLKLPEDK